METFRSNLEQLQTKKKELEELKSEVESKRAAFEQQIQDQRLLFDEKLLPLDQSIDILSQECDELGKKTISIPLVDLVYELAHLTGTLVSKMGISVTTNVAFWGRYSREEVAAMCLAKKLPVSKIAYKGKEKVQVVLKEYKNPNGRDNTFYFCISFPLDLKAIQGDGKTLLEHCNIKREYDDIRGHYTKLLINRHIEDILCVIKLKDLVEETPYYRPTGLLRKAVLNCLPQEEKVKSLQK